MNENMFMVSKTNKIKYKIFVQYSFDSSVVLSYSHFGSAKTILCA